jgi:DNA-binding transcriptional LysR family regulator
VEFRHLRYFVAVAEELNFSRAARRLNMAQPPLSQQIHQLEEETGVQLFVRNKRRVELTSAGHVFLEEARKLFTQAQHAVDAARLAQRGETGLVKIGIASGLGEKVNQAVAEHLKRFPGTEIQCQDVVSTRQNEALRELKIDVGFLRPPIDLANLESEVLFEERFFVVLPREHPLAKYPELRLKDIANEPLLLFDRSVSSGVYDKGLELYRQAGIVPKVIATLTDPHEEAGIILVISGKGIYLTVGAILSHPVSGPKVSAVPLNEPGATIDVHIAWRKNEPSTAILAFVDSARRAFARRG